MSKRKKVIAIMLMLLAIGISFWGGQTFSKYVTEVKGTGKAEIATWNFKVNENEEQIQTIELAGTATSETVAENKIAPGTKGSFTIKIDGSGSEVGINYQVKVINESRKPTNLVFTYEGKIYASMSEIEKLIQGTIEANAEEKVKNVVIEWEWPYETGTQETMASHDKIDTQNAKEINNYTFDILVSGIQAIPQT